MDPPWAGQDGAAPQISAADQAAFANMLGMLQGWRSAIGLSAPGGQPGMGPALPTNDLMSILSLMQHDGSAHFTPAGEAEQSLAGQLRQQMTQSARKLGVRGDNLNLDGLDGDAVDLVALLFDVLLDGPQYDTQIRQKIGRMLVPYVKVAVKDRRMFMFKEHPARKLLNTVAEACEGNRGEAPQERELLTRVDHTIDRLVAEFNEDVAIFETLEQELRAYMAQHRKRFELAEKRTAEAQRGRERLEHARKVAAEDLDRLRGDRLPPPVIGDFLSRHASHHLTQVALRDGRGAPRYEEALRAVEQLLAAFDEAAAGVVSASAALQPDDGLRAILASAGCVGEAAQAALDALRDALSRLLAGQVALEDDARMPAQVTAAEPAPEPEPQLEVGGRLGEPRLRRGHAGTHPQAADRRLDPARRCRRPFRTRQGVVDQPDLGAAAAGEPPRHPRAGGVRGGAGRNGQARQGDRARWRNRFRGCHAPGGWPPAKRFWEGLNRTFGSMPGGGERAPACPLPSTRASLRR